MDTHAIPELFRRLQAKGFIQKSDIAKTKDGFFAIYKSLSDILAEKGICDFPDSKGERLPCSKFFDDWYLYAVPDDLGYVYSLFKLREQEHDTEDGSPADGDAPGVTICFIPFRSEILFDCIENPSDKHRKKLNTEINRVVAHGGQRHHPALKKYFINPKSEGAYLVASLYTRHIASFVTNGYLEVPDHYKEIVQQCLSYKDSPKLARVPQFIEMLNERAGITICNHEKIRISNPAHLTVYESSAILATHTGNTSVYSFAAEVEYHARFLNPFAKLKIPFFGKSIYASAIRADMSIDDTEFSGPAPFYRTDSKIFKRQYSLHRPGPKKAAATHR